jgi:hypothetical protein
MPTARSLCTRIKFSLTLLSSLVSFATLSLNDARADRVKALAAPPIILWTDQNLSNAQHVANAISNNFGTIQNFSRGTFIGGIVPPIKVSPTDKINGTGNAFGWTIGVRGSSNGNDAQGNSFQGNGGGGASSSVPQISASGQLGGSGVPSSIVASALTPGVDPNGDTTSNLAVPVLSNPLPPSLLLFAGGIGALGLLGWSRKRKVV